MATREIEKGGKLRFNWGTSHLFSFQGDFLFSEYSSYWCARELIQVCVGVIMEECKRVCKWVDACGVCAIRECICKWKECVLAASVQSGKAQRASQARLEVARFDQFLGLLDNLRVPIRANIMFHDHRQLGFLARTLLVTITITFIINPTSLAARKL